MQKKSKTLGESNKVKAPSKLYTLLVYLTGGPIGGEFEGQVITRTIQIRGDQTLEKLHTAIFKAFDRFEQHFYELCIASISGTTGRTR